MVSWLLAMNSLLGRTKEEAEQAVQQEYARYARKYGTSGKYIV